MRCLVRFWQKAVSYIKTEQMFLMNIETFPLKYCILNKCIIRFHFQLLFLTFSINKLIRPVTNSGYE